MAPKKLKSVRKKASIINTSLKEYSDHSEVKDTIFLPFQIEAKSIETVIVLLNCPEDDVILQALHHLDKFAIKHSENLELLVEKNILIPLLRANLIERENLLIQRFMMKLLSQICELNSIKLDGDTSGECFQIFIKVYETTSDKIMKEFALLGLYHVCDDPKKLDELESSEKFLREIFENIETSTDPDIFLYSIRILYKILCDPDGLERICNADFEFPLDKMTQSLKSSFKEIQESSVEIFSAMAFCPKLFYSHIEELFKEFFIILENLSQNDLHEKVILTLRRFLQHKNIAKKFCEANGYLKHLFSLWKKTNSHLHYLLFGILREIAEISELRVNLYDHGIVQLLGTSLITVGSDDVLICTERMMHYKLFLKDFLAYNPVEIFLKILQSETKNLSNRTQIAIALNSLFHLHSQSCWDSFENHNILSILADFLRKPKGEVPLDIMINLTKIVKVFATVDNHKFMNEELADGLIYAMENSNDFPDLMVILIKCASLYFDNRIFQEKICSNTIKLIILECLQSTSTAVKNAICEFINISSKLVRFCDYYIDDGILKQLLKDEKSWSKCENWDLAINGILAYNLSMKIEIKKSLAMTDKILDQFYVSKHNWSNFEINRNIMQQECSPLHSIIFVNFNNEIPISESVDEILINEQENQKKNYMANALLISSSQCYSRYPKDDKLPQLLIKLKKLFKDQNLPDAGIIRDRKTLIAKIEILAKLVASILSGKDCIQYEECRLACCHDIDLHLCELKCQLNCNIIPLGIIKLGGKFERALLFKVLADRVDLPCTLNIINLIAWNEVAIPDCDDDLEVGGELLKTNYLVDLMNNPGELFDLDAPKAVFYQK